MPKNHFRTIKILFFSRFFAITRVGGCFSKNLENSRFFLNPCLRGLCDHPNIKADVYYTLINSTTFLGHIYSKIIYRNKMWDLVSTIDNSVIAFTTLENAHELPIGLHVWTFFPFTDNNCNNYPKLG